MMDSLILDNFPPYTFTKITTTHRPIRTSIGSKSKLHSTSASNSNIPSQPSVIGNSRVINMQQKTKIPMQGKLNYIYMPLV